MSGNPEVPRPNPEQFAADLMSLSNFLIPIERPIGNTWEEIREEVVNNAARWFNSELRQWSEQQLTELLDPLHFTQTYKRMMFTTIAFFKDSFFDIELSHTPIDELLEGKTALDTDQARQIEEDAFTWYIGYEKLPGETREYSLNRRHLEKYIKGGIASVLEREAEGKGFPSAFALDLNLELWEAEFEALHGYTPRIGDAR